MRCFFLLKVKSKGKYFFGKYIEDIKGIGKKIFWNIFEGNE